VGVLEMLDKRGGAPFGVRDMEILGHFARLGALAVQQMLLFTDLRHLFRHLMADVLRDEAVQASGIPTPPGTVSHLQSLGRRFADSAAGRVHADSLRLAAQVWEVSRHGDAARRHASDVLTSTSRLIASVAAYAPTRS
jgi:hypothetical protein